MSNLKNTDIPKVIPFGKEGGLSQIYQSMALTIALAKPQDGGFKVITKGVMCRDFLCDVYSATLQKKSFQIYGMSWKGDTESPDFDAVYLNLVFPSAEAKKDFDKNLALLHSIEGNNKIPETVVYDTGGVTAFVVADKAWLQNVLLFSLYTFLLRAFSYKIKTKDWIKELGAAGTSDGQYIASIARETWDRILSDLSSIHTDEFCGLNFNNDGTGSVHHNSGFISVFGNHTELTAEIVKKNKHWRTMKERKFKTFTI